MATNEARERWFCELVDSGLGEAIFDSSDLMHHVTPEVLAGNLPPDLMAKVLESALSAGKLTTDRMLETLTPEVIAHHIPHDVLWACVTAAAKRSGIAEGNGEAQTGDKRRTFLRRALARGLDTEVLTSGDILNHTTPEVLAANLPTELKARLLAEGLRADAMNPALIVEVVGVEALASNIPLSVLWACLAEAGDKAIGGELVGAVGAATDRKKKTKPTKSDKRGAAKAKKASRATTAPGPNRKGTAELNDDTSVNDWADADDFDVVEEEELAAITDSVIGDWTDEETNVGDDSPARAK